MLSSDQVKYLLLIGWSILILEIIGAGLDSMLTLAAKLLVIVNNLSIWIISVLMVLFPQAYRVITLIFVISMVLIFILVVQG